AISAPQSPRWGASREAHAPLVDPRQYEERIVVRAAHHRDPPRRPCANEPEPPAPTRLAIVGVEAAETAGDRITQTLLVHPGAKRGLHVLAGRLGGRNGAERRIIKALGGG